MTTPSDPDGTGSNDDVPYLPPARPAVPEPVAPAVTAPMPPPAVDAAPGVGVAAPGEVERTDEPAYGSLPAATDATADAARRLRAEAQRRRRRNTRIGWVVTIVLFVGALVAGWFVYRAFDDERSETDATASESVPDAAEDQAPDVSSDAEPAVAPQVEPVSDASSASAPLSAGEPGSWAGLTPVTDGTGTAAPAPTSQDLPPPRIASRPAFRTIAYDLRVYDGFDQLSSFRQYSVTYDTGSDEYYGFVTDSATGASELLLFTGDWRHSVGADGVNWRVRRSEMSREDEPDTPIATVLGELDVLPLEARPFATLIEQLPGTATGLDGSTTTTFGYRVDLDAFRASAPEAHQTWRRLWSTAQLDNADLVVPGTEQIRLAEVTPYDELNDRDVLEMPELDVTLPDDRAMIVFSISERGLISAVGVVAPTEDLRLALIAHEITDEPTVVSLPDDQWVDAP